MINLNNQILDDRHWIGDNAASKRGSDLDLFHDIHQSDDALNDLATHYLPIVTYQAKRLARKLPQEVDAEDLVQAGFFGLREALLAYDINRGVKFETYCVPRVVGSMLDSIREMDWVPRLVRKESSILKGVTERLRIELNRDPGESELMDYFHTHNPEALTIGMIATIQGQHERAKIGSLSKVEFETDSFRDVDVQSTISDERAPDPAGRAENEDLRKVILQGFTKAQRLIYILYIVEELSMKEVGVHVNLSESRVSQMFGEMVRIWQQRVEAAGLEDSNSELAMIANQFNVTADESERGDISQEVIQRLDQMNSLSSISFCWQEGGEGYRGQLEDDPTIRRLIEHSALERAEKSSAIGLPERTLMPLSHRQAIPPPKGMVGTTGAFGFIFQTPQSDHSAE